MWPSRSTRTFSSLRSRYTTPSEWIYSIARMISAAIRLPCGSDSGFPLRLKWSNKSPPPQNSVTKYSLLFVWNAYFKSRIKGCSHAISSTSRSSSACRYASLSLYTDDFSMTFSASSSSVSLSLTRNTFPLAPFPSAWMISKSERPTLRWFAASMTCSCHVLHSSASLNLISSTVATPPFGTSPSLIFILSFFTLTIASFNSSTTISSVLTSAATFSSGAGTVAIPAIRFTAALVAALGAAPPLAIFAAAASEM
mmetsp:Transcript_13744/g.36616  ORF Transcript_13744/g.36616 Transcript_13744/m.36616 type:complete len:254 (+) Transcript_13744:951-1712(+)